MMTAGVPAVPTRRDLEKYNLPKLRDATTYKLSETDNRVQAKEPEHYMFVPVRFRGYHRGQWMVDLDIDRHNNLSRFSNVTDTWRLPRRHSAAKAFTKNLARVSRKHLLTILPSTDSFPFRSMSIAEPFSYALSLPSDDTLFRWLVVGQLSFLKDDSRSVLNRKVYQHMEISDKGQNLRGVISMFDHLSEPAELLTNQYWRNVLRNWKKDPNSNKIRERSYFNGFLPNTAELKDRIRERLGFKTRQAVTQYLEGGPHRCP